MAKATKVQIVVSPALQQAATTLVAKSFKGTANKDWQNSVSFFREQIKAGESPAAVGESLRIALKKQKVNNGSVRGYISMLKSYTEAGHELTEGIKAPAIQAQIKADKAKNKPEAPEGEGEGENEAPAVSEGRQALLKELAEMAASLNDDDLGTLILSGWDLVARRNGEEAGDGNEGTADTLEDDAERIAAELAENEEAETEAAHG